MPIQSLLDRIRREKGEPDAFDRYSSGVTRAALPALAGTLTAEMLRPGLEAGTEELTGNPATNRRILDAITERQGLELRTPIPPNPITADNPSANIVRDVLNDLESDDDVTKRLRALEPKDLKDGTRERASFRPFETEGGKYRDGTLRIRPNADARTLAQELGHATAVRDHSDLAKRIRTGATNFGPHAGIAAAAGLALSGNEDLEDLTPAALAAGYAPRIGSQAQALHIGARELDAVTPRGTSTYGSTVRRGLPGLLSSLIAPTVAAGASKAIGDQLKKTRDTGAIENLMKYIQSGNYL